LALGITKFPNQWKQEKKIFFREEYEKKYPGVRSRMCGKEPLFFILWLRGKFIPKIRKFGGKLRGL
jgi:hypothetical protein